MVNREIVIPLHRVLHATCQVNMVAHVKLLSKSQFSHSIFYFDFISVSFCSKNLEFHLLKPNLTFI